MVKMWEYAATEQLLILIVTLMVPPLLILVVLILLLATFGKSLGIRRAYVNLLLQIFEWASKRIEKARIEARTPDEESEDRQDQSEGTSPPDRRRTPSGQNLIKKDASLRIMRTISISQEESCDNQVFTIVGDSLDFVKAGIESIIEDEVTLRFSAEQLASWNLLSRTSYGYQYASVRLTILWCLGFLFRYFVLFPIRMTVFIIGLTFLVVSTAVVGYCPDGSTKRWLNWNVSLVCYRVLSRAVSVITTFHNSENKARPGGICVANHTSPIDVLILAIDNCYALVGQSHGGVLGLIQRSLSRASDHIWFERSEANDRTAVRKRLQEHVENVQKLPILLFPEGTCINNTSVMMFKKGSFEVGGCVYPVAIKYDARFGDAFWNSSQQSWMQYLIMMMTSWAIVVDVWYLPPMIKEDDESAVQFAARVKRAIAAAGGLVDLEWDGQLKRYPVKKEMKEKQQEIYSKRIQSQENFNKSPSKVFVPDEPTAENNQLNSSSVREEDSPAKSLLDLLEDNRIIINKENKTEQLHSPVLLSKTKADSKESNDNFLVDHSSEDNLPLDHSLEDNNLPVDHSSEENVHVLDDGTVITEKCAELEAIKDRMAEKIDGGIAAH